MKKKGKQRVSRIPRALAPKCLILFSLDFENRDCKSSVKEASNQRIPKLGHTGGGPSEKIFGFKRPGGMLPVGILKRLPAGGTEQEMV